MYSHTLYLHTYLYYFAFSVERQYLIPITQKVLTCFTVLGIQCIISWLEGRNIRVEWGSWTKALVYGGHEAKREQFREIKAEGTHVGQGCTFMTHLEAYLLLGISSLHQIGIQGLMVNIHSLSVWYPNRVP